MPFEHDMGDYAPENNRQIPDTVGLTEKQARLLLYLDSYSQRFGFMPSYDEMADEMGVASKSSVHRLITGLEQRGKIRRIKNHARAIEIATERNITTRRALEVVLSRCKLNKQAANSLRYLLAFERAK